MMKFLNLNYSLEVSTMSKGITCLPIYVYSFYWKTLIDKPLYIYVYIYDIYGDIYIYYIYISPLTVYSLRIYTALLKLLSNAAAALRQRPTQWRNQSPTETRATAQYKTNHNYDNCKLKLALELFGRPRSLLLIREWQVGNYSNIITILVKTRRKR